MNIATPHKAVGHLLTAVDDTETWLNLNPQEFEAFTAIDGDYVFALLRGTVNRELVKIDLAASVSPLLKVSRGEGGTSAETWPLGSMLFSSTHEDHYNAIIQRGENRIIDYNPNQVLNPLFAGEKVYQSGPDNCEKRWWKSFNGVNPYWALITGVACSTEDWLDIGWDHDLLIEKALTWVLKKDLSNEIPAQDWVYAILYDAEDKFVLAITGQDGQIWKSTDGGDNWTLKKDLSNESPGQIRAYSIVKDINHDTIVVGTGLGAQLWSSADKGETWALKKSLWDATAEQHVYSICYDSSRYRLICGTGGQAELWVSTDGGATWTWKKELYASSGEFYVRALVYDSYHDKILAGTGSGGEVWSSSDGGETWTQKLNLSESTVASFVYDPVTHNVLLGTIPNGQIHLSTDGGENWTLKKDLSNESPSQTSVLSLGYTSNNGKLYAGTGPDCQIWVSTDAGETWSLDEELSDLDVNALGFDANFTRLLAGTRTNALIYAGI